MNRGHAFTQLILARMREFFREPVALFWVYGFPLILAVMLGLAFSRSTPEPTTIDVVEPNLRESLEHDGFDIQSFDRDTSLQRLRQGKTTLVVEQVDGAVVASFDPTRPDSVQAWHLVEAILSRGPRDDSRDVRRAEVIAPGSRYIDFLLPGLVGINIMGGGLFGIGFVLVDMRVRKLFKRLMATPLHRGDFLLSLVASRLLFLAPEMVSLLVIARWLFGVPVVGSWGTLIVVVIAGALAFAGIGLLLGSRTEKTETISGLINLIMLPMYMVSGVFFSSKRFPDVVQPLIQALPLTRLNDALREVMLEGAGLVDISGHLVVLALWGGISFALALRWFKWT